MTWNAETVRGYGHVIATATLATVSVWVTRRKKKVVTNVPVRFVSNILSRLHYYCMYCSRSERIAFCFTDEGGECYSSENGLDSYRGNISVTSDGTACILWENSNL